MRFVVDAQLPPALARWLISRDHEAEHVADVGLASASDEAIWAYAGDVGASIVTKDEDFAYRRIRCSFGQNVIWLRLRNTRKAKLLAWFESALPSIEVALQRRETVIEVA